jgi:hypothetical protein
MRFLLLLSCLLCGLQKTACLALKPDNGQPINCVVSTSKSGGHAQYLFFDKSALLAKDGGNKSKFFDALRGIRSGIRATFLPSGYPTKTPPGYLKYSAWSWVQDLSTQLRSVLATQRVLEGVGVGREGATALSALMNYLVRDGCGMGASLLFTSAASSKFRTDVKRWRLFADLMVDLGITLEVTAVLLPRALFLPMISVGNMCKAMCGVAAGACGGAINLHWAKGTDISDINAKFGAQHTVTGALGLVFSAVFARSVDHVNQSLMWTLYSILTLLHIYANMQCMRLISFDSLSSTRMNMILAEFIQSWVSKEEASPDASAISKLSSPLAIAQTEPLFFGTGRLHKRPKHRVHIHFGVDYNKYWAMSKKSDEDFDENDFKRNKENYLISSGWERSERDHCVVVSLFNNITPKQEAKAYFHATLLALQLDGIGNDGASRDLRMSAEAEAKASVDRSWHVLEAECRRMGWDLGKTELRTLGYEVKYVSDAERTVGT